MQELAGLALFTQPPKPMLAHQIVEVGVAVRCRVFVGTGGAEGTVAL